MACLTTASPSPSVLEVPELAEVLGDEGPRPARTVHPHPVKVLVAVALDALVHICRHM